MAREMSENQLTAYRAVVTVRLLEDQRIDWVTREAGYTFTKVFGPYARAQDARDWTRNQGLEGYRREPTGKRNSWGNEVMKYIPIIEKSVKYQRLEPVFHLTPEKGLQLGLEWVTYA